ncbi:tyrosine-type recombinase/integrase [Methylobacterium sp. NPDC080182]|uniref:tyrosine-type recombinase/integrase n=1 Tax=Methylobacterium sp. NPDC080182 TaxID=3390590 RepID=UPI003CFC310B
MRLTKQAIEALTLPPGKKDAFFWDDTLKGFGVKLNAGGARQYVAQYRTQDGRSRRITLGRVDTLSLDEARRKARTDLAKAQTGSDPQAEKAEARRQAGITLGSVTATYLAKAKERLKPRSYQEVERHLMKAWAPLAGMPLNGIKRADVAAQLNTIAENGPVNANRARSALSGLYSWAIGDGRAESNPVTGTNKQADEKPRDRFLSCEEVQAVWKACRNDDHGVMVKLLLLTAQRRNEVGNMDEAELDLDGAVWMLPGDRAKNGRKHEVPLSPLAVQLLRDKPRLAGRSLVFGQGVGGFSGWSNSKERLDKRIAAAGATLAPWTVHDLRRTATTLMAEHVGVQPHILSAITNHTPEGMKKVYNLATYRVEKRDALNRWADFLANLTR